MAFVFLDHLLCLLRQLYWLNYISGPSFHFRAAQVLESSERVPLSAEGLVVHQVVLLDSLIGMRQSLDQILVFKQLICLLVDDHIVQFSVLSFFPHRLYFLDLFFHQLFLSRHFPLFDAETRPGTPALKPDGLLGELFFVCGDLVLYELLLVRVVNENVEICQVFVDRVLVFRLEYLDILGTEVFLVLLVILLVYFICIDIFSQIFRLVVCVWHFCLSGTFLFFGGGSCFFLDLVSLFKFFVLYCFRYSQVPLLAGSFWLRLALN